MQASSSARNPSWLRTAATGGLCVCAILAVAVLLTGVAGCPQAAPTPTLCDTDGDCDDGLFCTGEEFCDNNGRCEDGPLPCPVGDSCVEGSNECVQTCDADSDCNDDQFCNGEESCGGDGLCVTGENPCGATQVCDEDLNICAG